MDVVTLQSSKAFARGLRSPNTVVWFGDSETANGDRAVDTNLYKPNGYWCWLQFFLRHRLSFLSNAGVAGNTTAQMLARISTDVLALRPGWCFVMGGTNDVGTAVATATTQANLTAIWNALDAAGIRVVALTIPPRTTYTGSMRADTETLNQWIRDQGRKRKNLIVVDAYAAVVAASGGTWQSNTTPDGVHFGNIGAALAGRAAFNVLDPLIPGNLDIPSSEGDATQILSNACFATGGAGSTPTGWSEHGTSGGPIVYSKRARNDFPGRTWQTLSLPNGCQTTWSNNNNLASRFTVGDTVVALVEVQVTNLDQAASAATMGLSLRVQALDGGAASLGEADDMYWAYSVNDNMPAWDRTGLLRTPPLVVPVGTVALQLALVIAGGGTYDFDRAAIVNVTKYGLAA